MILFDLKNLGHLQTGFFLERKNRFLATAIINGSIQKVHIADTGRLEEILTPNRVLLLLKNRPGLKTNYTLIAAKMEESWVLINTKLHSPITKKAIEMGVLGFVPKRIKSEVTFGKSRIDFKVDETFVEIKGCSLVIENTCLFPNAPTTRGVKHIEDLIEAKRQGFDAYILVMAVRKCRCFAPHPSRDPNFKAIFYKALGEGVQYRGFFATITPKLTAILDGELPLCRGVAQPG